MFKSLLKSFRKISSFITNQKPYVYGITYLLLIPIFAFLFYFLPGLEIEYTASSSRILQSFYFSVVTITTLGYGDITPQNSSAQILAAIESVFGVVVIGLFLNSLSHSLSLLSQKAEQKKAQQERYRDEVIRLQKFNRLIQLDIDNYLTYTVPIITPISNRFNPLDKSSNSNNYEEKINEDFAFNDMQDLFKSTTRMTDHHFKPAIAYYFESQTELQVSIKNLIFNVNLGYWSDLENICLDFLKKCKSLDFSEYILNQPNTRIGSQTGAEFDTELIKKHQGEVKFLSSNSINAYVALYYLIKSNLIFVKSFRAIVEKIFTENEIK